MRSEPQTVLIVDDDPQVLRLLEKMLRPRSNVKVLLSPRPADAIQICEREPVHLLISDVSMPEMDGDKLAERVVKLQPQIRVLLISGLPRDPPPAARNGRVRFLKKPFFPSQLLAQLAELLG
jgi:two-component system, cell cycle sensor histidine kinase and response regulator CckA